MIRNGGVLKCPAQSASSFRSPGSRNRRTEEWQDYLLQRYTSPLIVLAETYSRPAQELAKDLGCKKLEAFKVQMETAEKLAPFIHQKQPVAVNVDGSGVISLVIQADPSVAAMAGQAPSEDGLIEVLGRVIENEENQ